MNNIVPFQRYQSLSIDEVLQDPDRMRWVLTDPDYLAAYVNWFYGPKGPCPTRIASDDPEDWDLAG